MKQQSTCATCSHYNVEAYRAIRIAVCYQLETRDGKAVAIEVKPKRKACDKYSG